MKVTEEEAITQLRTFMYALQKYRSVAVGKGPRELGMSGELAADVWPWVFGEKCPLPALANILDNVDRGKSLAPMDYYNQMTILTRFMPGIRIITNSSMPPTVPFVPEFMTPDVLTGWEV